VERDAEPTSPPWRCLDQPPGASSRGRHELREAVIKHVHSEAKLYPGRARRGLPSDSARMHEASDPWPALGSNVTVNENRAEPCLCLLCQMPSDQHHDGACALLHPGSAD